MSKARELLLSSTRPLFEIAQECGFEDPLYFSRIFRRETGISPRGYRRGFTGTIPVYDSADINTNSEIANQLDLSRKKMRRFVLR
jgi:AraC-like DNA-binding protein